MKLMKKWMIRASALALAASFSGFLGCQSGCGGGTQNPASSNGPSSSAQSMTCAPPTRLSGNQCVYP